MPFGQRVVFANLWLFAPLVEREMAKIPQTNAGIRTTTAPTIFAAGVKDNVLPATARAVVNFRILPGDTVDTVVEHVRAHDRRSDHRGAGPRRGHQPLAAVRPRGPGVRPRRPGHPRHLPGHRGEPVPEPRRHRRALVHDRSARTCTASPPIACAPTTWPASTAPTNASPIADYVGMIRFYVELLKQDV